MQMNGSNSSRNYRRMNVGKGPVNRTSAETEWGVSKPPPWSRAVKRWRMRLSAWWRSVHLLWKYRHALPWPCPGRIPTASLRKCRTSRVGWHDASIGGHWAPTTVSWNFRRWGWFFYFRNFPLFVPADFAFVPSVGSMPCSPFPSECACTVSRTSWLFVSQPCSRCCTMASVVDPRQDSEN